MIKLDILSDPICPWCYIGKTYLERALQAHPDHPFTIEWHPFQLNPDMPADGIDRREYLERKFGGQQGAIDVYSRIDQAAQAAGLDINWAGITKAPNTMDAHRLIHWAGIEQRQNAVVDALFRAYFVEGSDIGDKDILADLAQKSGLDGAVTRRLLSGDDDIKTLQQREAHSRKMGVSAVPTFIVANQAVVSGAQQPEFWAEVIRDAAQEQNN